MLPSSNPDIDVLASPVNAAKWSGLPFPRVLSGGAGAPNYGDELIVKGWIDYLEEFRPARESFVFFENIAKNCTELHLPPGHSMSERVLFRGGLSLLGKQAVLPTIWDYIERGFSFMRDFGFAEFGHKNFAEMFDTESIHFHGGGYLVGAIPQKAFQIGLAASFAKIYGTRLFATGIGFGPIAAPCTNPARFEEIMNCFEFFEVRDAVSFDLMKSVAPTTRVFHGTDDCFMVPADKVFRRDSSVRRLHLSLSHRFMENYPASFGPWVTCEAKHFDEVVFWESYPWFDKTVYEKLREWIPNLKAHATSSLLFDPPAIGDEDVFVTHRFHVHYAAARAGARGFYLAPTPYYVQKHESITALGSGLLPLDLDDLPSLENIPAASALDEAALRAEKLKTALKCYPVIGDTICP